LPIIYKTNAKDKKMDYKNREFAYNCNCGHAVRVFIDFGIPQEKYKCKRCGNFIAREEVIRG